MEDQVSCVIMGFLISVFESLGSATAVFVKLYNSFIYIYIFAATVFSSQLNIHKTTTFVYKRTAQILLYSRMEKFVVQENTAYKSINQRIKASVIICESLTTSVRHVLRDTNNYVYLSTITLMDSDAR
jgi:hypothetical protein